MEDLRHTFPNHDIGNGSPQRGIPQFEKRPTEKAVGKRLERVNDFDTAGGRSLGSEFWFFERRVEGQRVTKRSSLWICGQRKRVDHNPTGATTAKAEV